jgi:hypothetical protein
MSMFGFVVVMSAFVAGFIGSIFVWPAIRAHAFGIVAEIASLRARAKVLEDSLKGGE